MKQQITNKTKEDSTTKKHLAEIDMSTDDTRILEISIPKHKKIQNVIFYEIVLITNIHEYNKCYSRVFRRYSEFKLLKKVINKTLVLPEFPPKKFFNLKETVISERKNMLSVWIRFVAKLIEDENCYEEEWAKEVISFIQADKYLCYEE